MVSQFLDIFSLTPNAFLMHLNNIFYGRKKFKQGKTDNNIDNTDSKRHVDNENEAFQARQKQFARDIYGKFFRQTLPVTVFIPLIFLGDFSAYRLFIIVGAWLVFSLITVYLNKHIMPYHFLPVVAPLVKNDRAL